MVNFCSIFLILGGDNPVGQRSGARGANAPVIKRLIRGAFSIKLAYVILSENEPLRPARDAPPDRLHICSSFPCDLRVGAPRFVLYIDADGGLRGSLELALFAAVVVINHGSNNKHQSSAAVAVSASTFITALVLNQPPIYLSIIRSSGIHCRPRKPPPSAAPVPTFIATPPN
jgi:hypothetical protein